LENLPHRSVTEGVLSVIGILRQPSVCGSRNPSDSLTCPPYPA
jgi:hypothetical protein